MGEQTHAKPGGEELAEEAPGSAGVCHCSGFKDCPTRADGWHCSLASATPANVSDGFWQASQASGVDASGRSGSAGEAAAALPDLCRCRSEGERTVLWLTPAERAALRDHPLSEVISVGLGGSEKKTGVSGKTIKKQVHQHSTDGQERVVLTISDDKHQKKRKEVEGGGDEGDSERMQDSVGLAAKHVHHRHVKRAREEEKGEDVDDGGAEDVDGSRPASERGEEDQRGEELTESCVVTDGRPELQGRHLVVLVAMLAPLLVVLLVMAQIRWRCVYAPCGLCPRLRRSSRGSLARGAAPAAPPSRSPAPYSIEALGEVEKRPPATLVTLLVLLVVLLKITVTAVISTSHILVTKSAAVRQGHAGAMPGHLAQEELALGGASSGLLIAAEPVGGVVGVLLAERTRLMWPKETWLASCIAIFVGCVGFILSVRLEMFWAMLAFRAVSGLGEGACFIAQVFLARLSSPSVRTEVFSIWELGVAAGLILGPVLTSASSHVFSGNVTLALEGGIWFAVVMAVCLFFAMWAFLPSSEELCAAADVGAAERPAWQMDVDMPEEKWAAVLVVCSSTTVRLLSRLIWESSAVLVLTAHFCLGYSNAGYVASFVILFYFCSQAGFVRLSSWVSDHNLVRFCELIELFGLIMMFRPPRDLEKTVQDDIMQRESALIGIMVFLLGSGLFYTGNCLTSAPLNSWGTKRGAREVCVLFYQNFSVQTGVAGGAVLSRLFAGADPHQNTLVFVLLPALLGQILLSEIGLGACAPEHDPECVVEAGARNPGRKDPLVPSTSPPAGT